MTIIGLLLALMTGFEPKPLQGELRDVARAERLWNARPFTDYTYELREDRGIPGPFEWVEVTVRAGRITSARVVGADTLLPRKYLRVWASIDTLLGRLSLMQQIKDGRSSRKLIFVCDNAEVSFDRVLGFPAHMACSTRPDARREQQWIRNVRALR